eukprot:NODE_50_length_31184_cov_0.705099.p2 type:complete len:704 gc:universal NODE_50_length_31184_cov_0.705099:19543-21654(+)
MTKDDVMRQAEDLLNTKLDEKLGLVYYVTKKGFLTDVARRLENDDSATFVNSCHFRGIDFIQKSHIDNIYEEISIVLAAFRKLILYNPIVKEKRSSGILEAIINDEKLYLKELRRNLSQLDAEFPSHPIRLCKKHMIRTHYEFYKSLKESESVQEIPQLFHDLCNSKTKNIYVNYKAHLLESRNLLIDAITYFELPLNRFNKYSELLLQYFEDLKKQEFLSISKELADFNLKIALMKKFKKKQERKEIDENLFEPEQTFAKSPSKDISTDDESFSSDDLAIESYHNSKSTSSKEDVKSPEKWVVSTVAYLENLHGDFICQGSVWEILNSNLVKERTIYLYEKSLVIAKDLDNGTEAFEVRSILNLQSFRLVVDRDSRRRPLKLKSKVAETIDLFNSNPEEGIARVLAEVNDSENEIRLIVAFLHKTPGLDRKMIAQYLVTRQEILNAYMKWFDTSLHNLRIDLAFRLCLDQIYLPTDQKSMEMIMRSFSDSVSYHNPNVYESSENIISMLKAFLSFDDDLSWSFEEFFEKLSISSSGLTSDIAHEIFEDLQENALFSDAPEQRQKKVDISKIPEYLMMDDIVTLQIEIPHSDPNLKIIVCGQDMIINPSVLYFTESNICKFTVLPSRSGRKKMFFVFYGDSSSFYEPIGPQTISVERDFMKYTFLLKGIDDYKKSQFLFAVATKSQKAHWLNNLIGVGMRVKG